MGPVVVGCAIVDAVVIRNEIPASNIIDIPVAVVVDSIPREEKFYEKDNLLATRGRKKVAVGRRIATANPCRSLGSLECEDGSPPTSRTY